MDPILQDLPLPQEILRHIFQYLDWPTQIRIERVCQRWRRILCKLWSTEKELNFPMALKSFADHDRDTILLALLTRSGPNLERLILENSQSERLPGRYHEATHELIEKIIDLCPRLRELNLSHHRFDEPEVFRLIADRLGPTLESLILDNCQINTAKPEDIEFLKILFSKLTRLRILSFKGRGFCYGALKVTENVLELLSSEMEQLDISMGQSLQIYSLKFCSRFSKLRGLSIQRSQIIDSSLDELVEFCPQLEKLDISFCLNLRSFTVLTGLKSLTYLCLNGLRDHLQDNEFISLCRSLELEHLSIESCVKLTSFGIRSIAKLPNLRYLSVAGLQNFTDPDLCQIAKGCSKLEELHLSYCRKLTELGLASLAFCHEMKALDVSGIQVFTPEIFSRLHSAMPKLEKLEMISTAVPNPRALLARSLELRY